MLVGAVHVWIISVVVVLVFLVVFIGKSVSEEPVSQFNEEVTVIGIVAGRTYAESGMFQLLVYCV